MKDQNTPTNTLELRSRIRCVLGYCEVSEHKGCLYESSRNDSQELDLIMQLVSEAVNKAVRTPYHERALLVKSLTRVYPSHLCSDDDEPDWVVVCIHTPNGQAGWHISARDKHLFKDLKVEPNHYDGHSTEEKYKRLLETPNQVTLKDIVEGTPEAREVVKRALEASAQDQQDVVDKANQVELNKTNTHMEGDEDENHSTDTSKN